MQGGLIVWSKSSSQTLSLQLTVNNVPFQSYRVEMFDIGPANGGTAGPTASGTTVTGQST